MKFRWNAALALLMCGAVVLGTAGCGESDPNRRGKAHSGRSSMKTIRPS